jgi:hypothetical protein
MLQIDQATFFFGVSEFRTQNEKNRVPSLLYREGYKSAFWLTKGGSLVTGWKEVFMRVERKEARQSHNKIFLGLFGVVLCHFVVSAK